MAKFCIQSIVRDLGLGSDLLALMAGTNNLELKYMYNGCTLLTHATVEPVLC